MAVMLQTNELLGGRAGFDSRWGSGSPPTPTTEGIHTPEACQRDLAQDPPRKVNVFLLALRAEFFFVFFLAIFALEAPKVAFWQVSGGGVVPKLRGGRLVVGSLDPLLSWRGEGRHPLPSQWQGQK